MRRSRREHPVPRLRGRRMVRWRYTASVALVILSCGPSGEPIWVDGDSSSEGAQLFFDGRKSVVLRANMTQDSTVVATPFIGMWGDERPGDTVLVAGERRCQTQVRLGSGEHVVQCVC